MNHAALQAMAQEDWLRVQGIGSDLQDPKPYFSEDQGIDPEVLADIGYPQPDQTGGVIEGALPRLVAAEVAEGQPDDPLARAHARFISLNLLGAEGRDLGVVKLSHVSDGDPRVEAFEASTGDEANNIRANAPQALPRATDHSIIHFAVGEGLLTVTEAECAVEALKAQGKLPKQLSERPGVDQDIRAGYQAFRRQFATPERGTLSKAEHAKQLRTVKNARERERRRLGKIITPKAAEQVSQQAA